MNGYLTLTEVCVWAATRQEEAVERERPAETAIWLELYEPGSEVLRHPKEIFRELPQLCENGKLTMFGLENGHGDIRDIPTLRWSQLQIYESKDGFYAAVPSHDRTATWWGRLRIASNDAKRVWPAPVSPSDCPGNVADAITLPASAGDGEKAAAHQVEADQGLDVAPMTVPERRTGRRPKWDWDGAKAAFAAHLAVDPDGLPAIQADAETWVAEWFARGNSGSTPAVSEIRSKVVSPVYQAARSASSGG